MYFYKWCSYVLFSHVQRVRFSTSVLFSLSIGVELLTPAFPEYFLLLATIANIAKSISLAAYIATGVRPPPLYPFSYLKVEKLNATQMFTNVSQLEDSTHSGQDVRSLTKRDTNHERKRTKAEVTFFKPGSTELWLSRHVCFAPHGIRRFFVKLNRLSKVEGLSLVEHWDWVSTAYFTPKLQGQPINY